MGCQPDDDGRRVAQRHPAGDGQPPGERWALQAEDAEEAEEAAEDAAEDALDGGALAKLVGRPGGRQTGTVLLPFGIPGNDRDRPERRVDPCDEVQAPLAGIEPTDAWAQPL